MITSFTLDWGLQFASYYGLPTHFVPFYRHSSM